MAPHSQCDCLAWISYLWFDLFYKDKQDKFAIFSDDLVMDILARLPADDVLKCRRVCKSWKSLISTPSFIYLHLKRATTSSAPPSLFLQVATPSSAPPPLFLPANQFDYPTLFFTGDEYGHKKLKQYSKRALKKLEDYNPILLGPSCNGLLLFESRMLHKHFVINPTTQMQVFFGHPPMTSMGRALAIFFHPSTRDYKVLYYLNRRDRSNKYQYFTYSLRARTWKRTSSFSSLPTKDDYSTVILNGCLHWIVAQEHNPEKNNAIVIYNDDREDFRAMPHPGDEWRSNEVNEFVMNKMNLFKMNERLAFCRPKRMAIEIWVLKDYENWGWVKKHVVRVKFPKEFKLFGIQNDELLFSWAGEGVFLYALKANRFKKKIKEVETTKQSRNFEQWRKTVAYTKSLVSPVNV